MVNDKVPSGKLVVVVSGDLFLEPAEAILDINQALTGLPAATSVSALTVAITNAAGPDAVMVGFNAEAVAIAMFLQPGSTITYSICVPSSLVEGLIYEQSYAFLDDWVLGALRELGIAATYVPLNDITSPSGKIAGAAQKRYAAGAMPRAPHRSAVPPALCFTT